MDGDVYFAEHLIRERVAEVRAIAKFAALRGEPKQGARRAPKFGLSLLNRRGRRVAGGRRPLEEGAR